MIIESRGTMKMPSLSSAMWAIGSTGFVFLLSIAGVNPFSPEVMYRKRSPLHASESPQAGNDCIYLDCNGTTRVYPRVLESMMPYLTTHFGNPSSGHAFGIEPQQAITRARQQVLNMIGVAEIDGSSKSQQTVCWTSCGTEADNLAIHIALQATRLAAGQVPHVVTTNVEHPAIEACLQSLESDGKISVSYVPVGNDGRVTVKDVENALTSQTVLVTIMLANNESGALMPVAELASVCRKKGILLHTDAAQAVGKLDLTNYKEVDMMTIVGHKMGAPKGVACLYIRQGCLDEHDRSLNSNSGVLLLGGGQESGRRAGTENVPYIVGLGTASEIVRQEWEANSLKMEATRERLFENLKVGLGDERLLVNGPNNADDRLVNTLSIGIRGIHSGQLLASIANKVAASAGATCHGTASVSAVLQAMKVPLEFARGTIRLSVGPYTTKDEVDRACDVIVQQVKEMDAAPTLA